MTSREEFAYLLLAFCLGLSVGLLLTRKPRPTPPDKHTHEADIPVYTKGRRTA